MKLLFFLGLSLLGFSLIAQSNLISLKSDSTILGYYHYENGDSFVPGRQGEVSFFFSGRYNISCSDDAILCLNNRLLWTPSPQDKSKYVEIELIPTDSTKSLITKLIKLDVNENQGPLCDRCDIVLDKPRGKKVEFDLSNYVFDPENDQINYSLLTAFDGVSIYETGILKLAENYYSEENKSLSIRAKDQVSNKSINLNIEIHFINNSPPTINPQPDESGRISLGKVIFEGEAFRFNINPVNCDTLLITGNNPDYISFVNNQIVGLIPYTHIDEEEPLDFEKIEPIEIGLIASNTFGDVRSVFYLEVQSQPSEMQKIFYSDKRDTILSISQTFLSSMIPPLRSLNAELNELGRRRRNMTILATAIQVTGSIAVSSTPATRIADELIGFTDEIRPTLMAGLKMEEAEIIEQIVNISNNIQSFDTILKDFMNQYPEFPNKRFYARKSLNEMDSTYHILLSQYRQIIAQPMVISNGYVSN